MLLTCYRLDVLVIWKFLVEVFLRCRGLHCYLAVAVPMPHIRRPR